MEKTQSLTASYFSVSPDLVVVNEPVPYDLFINSSSIENREKFVRIFRKGGVLTREDVHLFTTKYRRIYLLETERGLFLRSLVKVTDSSTVEKTSVLKTSAIHHLQRLFEHEVSTEVLGRVISDCRDVVEGMIDVVGDCRVDQLQDLIANLSFHDFYTYDHSINVSMYCILIYRALHPEAGREEIVQAGLGGLLHDLGKVRISTEILNSPDKLTPEQFSEIQKHPWYGKELLEQVKSTLPAGINADLLGRVILEHHENFDGTGYPFQIPGGRLHLFSRVTTIADFFDAITTKRSYHEPLQLEDAVALMKNSAGKKIDPELFTFFVERTQEMELKKHLKRELAPDFDPCQPCRQLPLIAYLPKLDADEAGFGGNVRAKDDLSEGAGGKVKFIDPKEAEKLKREREKAQKAKKGTLKQKAG